MSNKFTKYHFLIYLLVTSLLVLKGTALFAGSVIDQRGEKIEVTIPAQRVVYIPPLIWSYLSVDKTSSHLVGTSAFALRGMSHGLMASIFPSALKIPDVTANGLFTPNYEAILAANPDVIFQTVQIGPEPYARLEKLGFPVVGITGLRGEKDFLTWIRLSGEVSGKDESAERLIKFFNAQLNQLITSLSKISEEKRPKVLYLMSLNPIRPAINGSSFHQAIRNAKGRNIAAGMTKWAAVNFEQVLLWNPDVILISGWPEERSTPEDLFRSRKWSVVRAVKQRRVYKAPMAGQRTDAIVAQPLLWWWLAEIFHPDRLTTSLRSRIRRAYKYVYDFTLNDAKIDRIINLTANEKSHGYGRFLSVNAND